MSKLGQIQQSKLTQQKTKADLKLRNLAASWYVAIESKKLKNKPQAIELFEQPLVAWRDSQGQPVIMGRYCSHMGASLSMGQVLDDCLQCPFHHWSFDNSGQCVSIPEVETIPSKAHMTTYVTQERYGYIWVWYGSEKPLFSLPEFPAAEQDRSQYMPSHIALNTTTTVPRLLENAYDYAHFVPVHDLKAIQGPVKSNLLHQECLKQQNELLINNEAWFGGLIEIPLKGYVGTIGAMLHRLGIKFETITLLVNSWPSGHVIKTSFQGKERLNLMVATTPVNRTKTIIHISIMVKKLGNWWLDIPYYIFFAWQPKASAMEDLPIWNSLKSDGGGSYVKHDLLILKFREFYQKWVNRSEL
jgi:aminopyrrolnitrin oxygenase